MKPKMPTTMKTAPNSSVAFWIIVRPPIARPT
jgi:hypothetical protein